ncbi:MAG: class I SAM-dependent methyltransferase [Candidatus Thermoplasmatota archaeon]|jgi:ubiquinone/menaquinone biosynthesis C-methylase UbiE|nr:class I SAM-dependent methyltransferase [Candidatus Thermoplasmatota archaeon]MCL5789905.1 class I SAM-dependent methyltransferase [Candidatus Thermoplasmatota archaeon]
MEIEGRYVPPALLNLPIRSISRKPIRVIRENVEEGDQVVDHGAGPGYYTVKISRIVGPRGVVYAVEPNEASLNALKRRMRKLGIRNVIPVKESGSHTPSIKDESIDFLFSNLTLCCLPDHSGAIDEIRRVLKQGASAFISVNTFGSAGDRYAVNKEEWNDLMKGFKIRKTGNDLIARWVLVSKQRDGM